MDAGDRVHDGGIYPFPLKRGATGWEVPFHKGVIGNFMV